MYSTLESVFVESSKKAFQDFVKLLSPSGHVESSVPTSNLQHSNVLQDIQPQLQQCPTCSSTSTQFENRIQLCNGCSLTSVQNENCPPLHDINSCVPKINLSSQGLISPRSKVLKTVPKSAIELYSWCPVNIQQDGDCCLAGIRSACHLCQFMVTSQVVSIEDDGRSVFTENGGIYYLLGPVSWSTYCALNCKAPVDILPTSLYEAFSQGFPKENWRRWVQGLHYFLSGLSDGFKVPLSPVFKSPKMMPKRSSKEFKPKSPYEHILNSYKCNVDLDSVLANMISDMKNGKTKPDSTYSGSQSITPNHDNDGSYDDDDDNEDNENSSALNNLNYSVISSSSDITSVSALPMLPTLHGTNSNHNRIMKKPGNREYTVGKKNTRRSFDQIIQTSENKSSIKRNLPLTKRELHNKSAVGSLYSETFDNESVDNRYRLYTESGRVVDARQLKRTRSGRWVLPKLDSRYAQSIVMEQDRILGVNSTLKL